MRVKKGLKAQRRIKQASPRAKPDIGFRSDWQPKSDLCHIQIGIRLFLSSEDGRKHGGRRSIESWFKSHFQWLSYKCTNQILNCCLRHSQSITRNRWRWHRIWPARLAWQQQHKMPDLWVEVTKQFKAKLWSVQLEQTTVVWYSSNHIYDYQLINSWVSTNE